MKATHMFRDQVNSVSKWFGSWNECEQTVGLYSLLCNLQPTQAKFLLQVLEQKVAACAEMRVMETQANSPAYINSLCSESKEYAVSQLLAYLPLLKPGNDEAKGEYLKLIPRILAHSIENGCHLEESRQLLSYSFIHPAITGDERNQVKAWLGSLGHMEDRASLNIYNHLQSVQQQQQQQQGNSAAGQQFVTDKNGRNLGGSNSLPGYTSNGSHQHQNGGSQHNGWQQQVAASRDSGIGLGDMDCAAGLQPFTVSSSGGCSAPMGRPITSSSAINGAGLNDCNTHTHSSSDNRLQPNDCTSKGHAMLHATHSGPPAFSRVPPPGCSSHQSVTNGHRKLSRSASTTPPISVPSANVSDWLNKHHDEMLRNNRSQTYVEPHAPLSPQSSVASSGSGSDTQNQQEAHQNNQQNNFLCEGSGMKDIPAWLKSLRLHKYSYMFQSMRYETMLNITEQWLEAHDVTKGARNKIVLSIKKLRDRQNVLRAMEKEIMEMGNPKQALHEIKSMLNTPMKGYSLESATEIFGSKRAGEGDSTTQDGMGSSSVLGGEGDSIPEGDLQGQLTRVIGKVCTQLMVTTRPDDECFALYLQLLDRCLMHESFTVDQKKKLSSWKLQIQKIWHPPAQKYNMDARQRRSFGGFSGVFPSNLLRNQRPLRGIQQPIPMKPGPAGQLPAKWTFTSRPTPAGVTFAANSLTIPTYNVSAIPTTAMAGNTFASRPAMYEIKTPVTRTHSAPNRTSQFGLTVTPRPAPDMSVTEPEMTARLDSLCLSMTEHAIGSLDSPDRGATF